MTKLLDRTGVLDLTLEIQRQISRKKMPPQFKVNKAILEMGDNIGYSFQDQAHRECSGDFLARDKPVQNLFRCQKDPSKRSFCVGLLAYVLQLVSVNLLFF